MSDENYSDQPAQGGRLPGMDLREPKFQWGQRVAATVDLVNDGSYPDVPADALLVSAGGAGEIVQIGQHVDANIPIYLVEFMSAEGKSRVIGCLEEELERV